MNFNKKKLALLLTLGMLALNKTSVVQAQDALEVIDCTDGLENLTKKENELVEMLSSGPVNIDKEWLIPYGVLSLRCTGTLLDRDYNDINRLLNETGINSLVLSNSNVEDFDFLKLSCSKIDSLALCKCDGDMDLAKLKLWERLNRLEICRTNFKNLDKLNHLEELSISTSSFAYPDLEDDFEFSRSFDSVVSNLARKDLGLKSLVVQGIAVSSIDIPLENLTIFYTDKKQIPDVLTFKSSNISLNGPCNFDGKDYNKPPILDADNCKRASLLFFDTALENFSASCITDLDFSFCNVNNSLEDVIAGGVTLNSTSLSDNSKYSTYSEYNDDYSEYETVYVNDNTQKEVGRSSSSEVLFKVKSYKFGDKNSLF